MSFQQLQINTDQYWWKEKGPRQEGGGGVTGTFFSNQKTPCETSSRLMV